MNEYILNINNREYRVQVNEIDSDTLDDAHRGELLQYLHSAADFLVNAQEKGLDAEAIANARRAFFVTGEGTRLCRLMFGEG